jgi:hypothetical protein
VLAAERAEQAHDAPVGQWLDQADGQAASEQAAQRRHGLAGMVGVREHRPGVR